MEHELNSSYISNGRRKTKLVFFGLASVAIIGFLLSVLFGDKFSAKLPNFSNSFQSEQKQIAAAPTPIDLGELSDKVSRNAKFDTFQEERLSSIADRLEKKADKQELSLLNNALNEIQNSVNSKLNQTQNAAPTTSAEISEKIIEIEGRLKTNVRGDTYQEERLEKLTRDISKQNEQIMSLADGISQKVIDGAKPLANSDLAERLSNVVRSNTSQEERLANLEKSLSQKLSNSAFEELVQKVDRNAKFDTYQEERLVALSNQPKVAPVASTPINNTASSDLEDLSTRLSIAMRINTSQEERLAQIIQDLSLKAKGSDLSGLADRIAIALRGNTLQEEQLNSLQNALKSAAKDSDLKELAERISIALRGNTKQEEQLNALQSALKSAAKDSDLKELAERISIALRGNTLQEERLANLEKNLSNATKTTELNELKDKIALNAKFDTYQEERLVSLDHALKALNNGSATTQSPANNADLALRLESNLKADTQQELRISALEAQAKTSTASPSIDPDLKLRIDSNIKTTTEQQLHLESLTRDLGNLGATLETLQKKTAQAPASPQNLTTNSSELADKVAHNVKFDIYQEERLVELDKKVAALEKKEVPSAIAPLATDFTVLNKYVQKEDLEALTLRLQSMQKSNANPADNARLSALLSLIHAATTGKPFTREVQEAKQAGIENTSLTVLANKAKSGTGTEKTLDKVLTRALNQIPLLPQTTAKEHLLASKPTISNKDTTSILSRMVAYVREGDMANALDEAYALPDTERAVLSPWISATNDKLIVDRALLNLQKEALTAKP